MEQEQKDQINKLQEQIEALQGKVTRLENSRMARLHASRIHGWISYP